MLDWSLGLFDFFGGKKPSARDSAACTMTIPLCPKCPRSFCVRNIHFPLKRRAAGRIAPGGPPRALPTAEPHHSHPPKHPPALTMLEAGRRQRQRTTAGSSYHFLLCLLSTSFAFPLEPLSKTRANSAKPNTNKRRPIQRAIPEMKSWPPS